MFIFTDWFLQHTNICVFVCVSVTAEGQGVNESPIGGNEQQAAANNIAHTHAANDDWRSGERGRAGSLLKAQVGSVLRSRVVCIWWWGSKKKKRVEENKTYFVN